jgi:hypothetical protein
MKNSNLRYPVLRVQIAAAEAAGRPAAFSLITDVGFHSVLAKLSYPVLNGAGQIGEDIVISLVSGSEEHIYFTGGIYDVQIQGAYRVLYLTDDFKKLCDTAVTPSYRKETAAAILQDALDAAGITDTKITCPAVEIARFASATVPADRCLDLLIQALEEHGQFGLRYFFDADNRFRFGTREDAAVNEGPVFVLESGDNILRRGNGWAEILPLPIRHSQNITVNGRDMITVRTELTVSKNHSRLRVWGAA